jgi:hypothetical protein
MVAVDREFPNRACSRSLLIYRIWMRAVKLYRERYAKRLVEAHGYSKKEAGKSAEAAEIDWTDFEPEDHADDEASYMCPGCGGRQTTAINGDEGICPECGGTGKRC